MGVIGSAKLLQALARDNLIPGFSVFAQGTTKADEPTYAICMFQISWGHLTLRELRVSKNLVHEQVNASPPFCIRHSTIEYSEKYSYLMKYLPFSHCH